MIAPSLTGTHFRIAIAPPAPPHPDRDRYTGTRASDPTADIDAIQTLHRIAPPDPDADGTGVAVAVIDSGIDERHDVFRSRNTPIEHLDHTNSGTTTDRVGHGTAVASLIARLAPGAALYSQRIFDRSGTTRGDALSSALDACEDFLATNPSTPLIVNFSLGTNQRVPALDQRINSLVEQGAIVIAASGNSGTLGGSPATAKRCISIGACDTGGELAAFSAANLTRASPEVSMIGTNVQLARAAGTDMGRRLSPAWVQASGTSFSAPEASALAARALSADRHNTQSDLRNGLMGTARDVDSDTERDGAGITDWRGASDTLVPDPEDHTPERSIEEWLADRLRSEHGEHNVERQHRFPDGRKADLLVHTREADECWELENDSGSVVNGSGQAAHYRQARVEEIDGKRNVRAVLGVPTGHIDAAERTLLRKRGIEVVELRVPDDVSIQGV
jgi:subtilisin family serine protease